MHSEFKIIINLEDLCAWAPINNSFVLAKPRWKEELDELYTLKPGQEGPPFWRGVLIQLGGYTHKFHKRKPKPVPRKPKDRLDLFADDAITFLNDDQVISTIKRDELERPGIWINILPKDPWKKYRPVPVKWDEVNESIFGRENGKRFSLHPDFAPYYSAITFWHNVESGYEVKVTQTVRRKTGTSRVSWNKYASHNKYVFTLKNGPYAVELLDYYWDDKEDKKKKKELLEDVDTIKVSPSLKAWRGGDHGTHTSQTKPIG